MEIDLRMWYVCMWNVENCPETRGARVNAIDNTKREFPDYEYQIMIITIMNAVLHILSPPMHFLKQILISTSCRDWTQNKNGWNTLKVNVNVCWQFTICCICVRFSWNLFQCVSGNRDLLGGNDTIKPPCRKTMG